LTPKKSDLGHFCLQCECHSHNVWILILFKDTQSHEILENPSITACGVLAYIHKLCYFGVCMVKSPLHDLSENQSKKKRREKNEWRSKENQHSKICNFKSSHERKLL